MRILIATTHRNLVGGVEKYLKTLIPGIQNCGHELGLLHERQGSLTAELIDPPSRSIASWCLDELGSETALDQVKRWKPDIVYSQRLTSLNVEGALLDSYPTVLFAHNYYGTCPTGQKSHSFPSARVCVRRSGPSCLVLHYPRRCGGLNPVTMWQMYQNNKQFQHRLPDYAAILVASHQMFREYRQHGVNARKLHLVPLPSPDGVTQLEWRTSGVPRSRVLFVGRLTKLKGGSNLIQAIPKAAAKLGRALTLVIAGDGPERERLENLADRLGLNARFTGWVDTTRKQDLMREADLLVVPSLWPEPFGLVGVEAGGLGLPAAAYAVGGITDWLIPGKSGELAAGDPPTVDGLADAIVRAVADPAHYAKLSHGAWEVASKLTLKGHLEELTPILDSVARQGTDSCLAAARCL